MENKERTKAMEWWNNLPFEEKFYKTIAANSVITGDHTRHPDTLTGREIEAVYLYHKSLLR